MAFILHGSCCSSHGHSHHGGHGHSHGSLGGHHGHAHSPPTDRQRSKYKRLSTSTTTADELGSKHLNGVIKSSDAEHASFVINGASFPVRSDSICSHRSPGHSRTNSFSGVTSLTQMRLEEAIGRYLEGCSNICIFILCYLFKKKQAHTQPSQPPPHTSQRQFGQ